MRGNVPLFSVMLVVVAFERGYAQAVDSIRLRAIPVLPTRYFAAGTFGPTNERDDSLLQFLFGRELAAAREPSFAQPGPVPSYRFAVIGGWGLIRLVRVERRGTGFLLVRKQTVVDTTTPLRRRLSVADSFSVSQSRARAFERALTAANFWEQSRFDMALVSQLDGATWLMEARDKRGTKVIRRSAEGPLGPPLGALTRALNELSREFFPRDIAGSRAPGPPGRRRDR